MNKHDHADLIGKQVKTAIPIYNWIGLAIQAEDPTFEPREFAAGMVGIIDTPYWGEREQGLIVVFDDSSWMDYRPDAFVFIEAQS